MLQLFFYSEELSIDTDRITQNINAMAKDLISSSDRSKTNQGIDAAQAIEVKADCIVINEFEVQVSSTDILDEWASFYMRREWLGERKATEIKAPGSLVDKLMEN